MMERIFLKLYYIEKCFFLVDIYFLLKIFVNNCWIEQQYVDRWK